MVTVNTEVKQPESPPKDWGVTVRKHKPKDFVFVLLFAVLTAAAAIYAYNPSTFGDEIPKDGRIPIWIMAITLAFVTLFCLGDPGGRYREADSIAHRRSEEWQAKVLIPYLEKRYGITFKDPTLFWGWGFPVAYKNSQTIEVHINGLNSERTSFDPQYDGGGRYRTFDLTEVWAEEVIRPESIRFRSLEEGNGDAQLS